MLKLFTKAIRLLFRLLYGFKVYNQEATCTRGPVLLLPNHVSWWDWILIGCCLEEDWRFVTSSKAAQVSWVHRFIMINRRTFPVDINSPYAVKHMAEYLHKGGRLVLFPEGRISCTGTLMKLFDGTGFLIHRTRAKIITGYLRGAPRLPFSRNPGKKSWFPKISLHFSNPLTAPGYEHTSATESRTHITDWLRDKMVLQQFETEMAFGPGTIPEAILEASRRTPGKTVLQDATGQRLSYRKLFVGATLLSRLWRDLLQPGEQCTGVLLPNVNGMPVVLLSLWCGGKTPAILNYTSGPQVMAACARLAGLKEVVTSRNFIARSKLDVSALQAAGVKLIYMEDVRKKIRPAMRILGMVSQWLRPSIPQTLFTAESVAVVLFTSGSEGDPKGVALTHRNVMANIRQMVSAVDLMETDRFFNALPLFHSFGLTVGLLLPLVHGEFTFLYVSPLHYRIVPAAIYDLGCTVVFSTNTFLNGYARKAHPYDFRTVRYIFAGAEKLQDATSTLWMRKFGIRIVEGYGVTETSPCLSANTSMRPRYGSAGQLLPGIEYKLEPVDGVPEGGRLLVRGPNIMKGYLNPEADAKFKALGGWYDTGDICKVDADGYVYILGRVKRFAKVSGEMVSLTAVEEALASEFADYGPKFSVAVIARPDEGKGEKLIALTNERKLTLAQVREAIQARGLSNLAVPRELKLIGEMPRLGSGKINYRELDKLV